MTQETLNYVKEQTEALIAAPSCSAKQRLLRKNGWLLLVLRKKQKQPRLILQSWKQTSCRLTA